MKTALTLAAGLAAGLAFASAAQAQYAGQTAGPYPSQYAPPPTPPGVYGRDSVIVHPATAGQIDRDGNWTLKRRENWLNDKINQAHDEHAIGNQDADRAHHALDRLRDDENHMRDRHDGQLTDNETINLEGRLDSLADEIQQLHENAWQRPW